MTRSKTHEEHPCSFRVVSCGFVVKLFLLACAFVVLTSCGARNNESAETNGVIIVNAPAAGVVRRVLVREGAAVNEGEALVEISVPVAGQPAAVPTQTEDPQARAARSVTTAQTEVEAARAEVVRTEVEVNRLTPLVAAGQATEGELDGARAQYEHAQQRLRQAQDAARNAQTGLLVARQQPANTAVITAEQIVAARATSSGTVSAISARVGDRVTAGQPLATLRAESKQ
jgi:multidrug efflux pump subunit AcrA (membrane-fusion protein)